MTDTNTIPDFEPFYHVSTRDRGDWDQVLLVSHDERLDFKPFHQALEALEKAVKEQEAAEWKIRLGEMLGGSDDYSYDPNATRFNAFRS
jgi:hypothetical protein